MLELDEENNSSYEGKDPRLTRPQKDALLFMDEFLQKIIRCRSGAQAVREKALARVAEGDIVHAESPGGANLICLVLRVTKDRIDAKTVTTQLPLSFDRVTGVAEHGDKRVPCRIDSIAPLPPDIHQIMLQLNEKHSPPYEGKKPGLTRSQIDALMFTRDFYKSHPLA